MVEIVRKRKKVVKKVVKKEVDYKTIAVRVSPEIYDRFKVCSDKQCRTMAAQVRSLVQDFINQNENENERIDYAD